MIPAPEPQPSRRCAVPLALTVLTAAGAMLTLGPAGSAQELRLTGVGVAVGAVSPEVMFHQASMPAGMMPDPLPTGTRRVALDVTLTGLEDGGRYDGRLLRLTGPGLEVPAAPDRTDLAADSLPARSRVTGTVVFTVPASAQDVALTAVGAEGAVPVRLPPAPPLAEHDTGRH